MKMKLNYKRTIFVGFAFFLICAFWQAYDNTIPLILTNKFGMSQTWSGVIMALDNVLALFLLPLFGAISDRSHSKRGRRTPFIVVGTLIAVVAFVALSFVDGAQLKNLSSVSTIDDPAALTEIYSKEADANLITPDGEHFVLSEQFSEEEFTSITSQITKDGKTITNPDYTNFVVPARQAYAWQATAESPATLIFFVALLLVVLVSMSAFRSPAVALMPDVTVKPLRSKANAVINLMGSAGGILVLALGMALSTSAVRNSLMSYTGYFCLIAGIMLLALVIFLWKVKEPQFVAEMEEDSVKYGLVDAAGASEEEKVGRKLTKEEKRSLIFILLSIVLWFFGYNAVTSKYSVYASNILHKDYNLTLIIAQAAAIVAYLPVGMIASKVGRKKTIMAGVVMLTAAFTAGCFMRDTSPTILMNAMFALAGIAWATINVNSFPMVVEMCSGGDVGKYTGFYYTASMAAQVATPMLSGFLMDRLGMTVLFPYAAVFVALAFVTMIFVHHGDSKPEAKKGLDALEDMDS
jgi:maltose/moltooligosaccharide transporter